MIEILFTILLTIGVSYFTIYFTEINIFSIIPMNTSKKKKIVIFDLDETLGSFLEVGIFWDALQGLENKIMNHFMKYWIYFQSF